MATTILARVAENKFIRLLCMAVLALIMAICFANFTNNHYFGLCFLSMLLWTDMCYEDATTWLVDIRKILFLGVSLMVCSYRLAGGFFLTYLLGLFVWVMFYFIMGLKANYLRDNSAIEAMSANEQESLRKRMDKRVPYLPFLWTGMIGMAVIVTIFNDYFSGVLYKAQMGDILYEEFGYPVIPLLMVLMAICVLVTACIYRYLMKRKRAQGKLILKPGIGMGDIILLPLFMSFFGDGFFMGMMFISFLAAGGYIYYQNIIQTKNKGDEA